MTFLASATGFSPYLTLQEETGPWPLTDDHHGRADQLVKEPPRHNGTRLLEAHHSCNTYVSPLSTVFAVSADFADVFFRKMLLHAKNWISNPQIPHSRFLPGRAKAKSLLPNGSHAPVWKRCSAPARSASRVWACQITLQRVSLQDLTDDALPETEFL